MTQLLQPNRPGSLQVQVKQLNPEFAISFLSIHTTDTRSVEVLDTLTQSKIKGTFRQSDLLVRVNEIDPEASAILPCEGSSFATLDLYLSFLAHLLDKADEKDSLAKRLFRDDFRPIICMSSVCLIGGEDQCKQNMHVLFGRDTSEEYLKFQIRLIHPPVPRVSVSWYRPLVRVVI